MEKYTGYLRGCTNIPDSLYYDLFASMCDADMQKKMENIKGIKTMTEKKIWEEIKKIFLASNPIYIRRVQALETRIIKGKTVSDFYHRLKNIFTEAEMEKASMGTIMISKLIASLPSEGNEGRIKEQLLKQYSEMPNPKEEDLTKFITVIKEFESLVTASEFKIQQGNTMRRVQEEPKQEANPHYLCGKVHKCGKCTQKCTGFDMIEADCWVLHPHKKPKDAGNTKRGKDRGRWRDRTRSKSRETEDNRTKKKGREQSRYPAEALRRVTS